MIKKLIITFVVLLFIALFLLSGVLFVFKKSGDFLPVSFLKEAAGQEIVKKTARKIKHFIYREATIHNPEGDTLPDEIDDEILNKIKEKLK